MVAENTVSYEVWDESSPFRLEEYQVRFSSDARARENAILLAQRYNDEEEESATWELRRPRPNKYFVVKATTMRERL